MGRAWNVIRRQRSRAFLSLSTFYLSLNDHTLTLNFLRLCLSLASPYSFSPPFSFLPKP